MPLGFERLNERTQRPNAHINFIRPLPGSTSSVAEGILNRVAAICYPFMKKHMILVQALEEFPFNNEFVGRNFNAGEVIQLVLRNRHGNWLPDRWIMMVMVHELAHCKQMNHSKAFWQVRNLYAADLRDLWAKGYTGEGLWGRGRALETGHIQVGSTAPEDIPEHLCGGAYGRRRKRRKGGKTTQDLSYAEKKQRRILKKFGAGGQALGADDDTKVKLEGTVTKGKPRVAGSARGRELRAAAALARFEVPKKESTPVKEEDPSDSETEDECEEALAEGAATDVDGKRMLDSKGRALVRICEDEDDQDEDAQRELAEFQAIPAERGQPGLSSKKLTVDSSKKSPLSRGTTPSASPLESSTTASLSRVVHLDEIWKRRLPSETADFSGSKTRIRTCPICSFDNDHSSLTCGACSHVLNPDLVPEHWRCGSSTCQGSKYINAGDVGRCGICGASRSVI